jgi:CDP-diacylglycerol--serine O-phosphatidyltransferase
MPNAAIPTRPNSLSKVTSMRLLRSVAVFPTLFTLGNLVCGFFAIVVAARVARPDSAVMEPAAVVEADLTNLMLSAWLIFLAMVFDALDGHVARLSRTTSDFGAQLDSLSDLVTFGVAPAFLLVKLCPRFAFLHREAVWIIAASFTVCAALRLARFNVETSDEDDHLYFSGLPTPAAALCIASFAMMIYTLRIKDRDWLLYAYAEQIHSVLQTILPGFAVVLALLMVSRIPYPHLVNQLFRGQRSFSHLVGLVFALVAIMVIHGYALPIVCAGYALGSPVRYGWEKLVQRRHQEESLF